MLFSHSEYEQKIYIEPVDLCVSGATCRVRCSSGTLRESSPTRLAGNLDGHSRTDAFIPRALVDQPRSQHAQRRQRVMDTSQRHKSNSSRRHVVGAKIFARVARYMVSSGSRREGLFWHVDVGYDRGD